MRRVVFFTQGKDVPAARFRGAAVGALLSARGFATDLRPCLPSVYGDVRYAFDSIAASVFSEALHLSDRARLQYNLTLMSRWVISVAAPLAALTISLRGSLLGLYGPEFVAGASALVVLTFGHLVNASCLSPWLLVVGGQSGLMLLANFFAALLNIGLGLLLIPRHGIVGTACAVTASVLGLQVFLGVASFRLHRVHPFDRRVLKPLAAAALVLVVEQVLPIERLASGVGRAIVLLVTGLVVYGAAMLLLGLPDEERRLLARLRLGRRP